MQLAFERNNLMDAGWEIIAENDARVTVSHLFDHEGRSCEAQIILCERGDKLVAGFPFDAFDESPVAERTLKLFKDTGTTYEVLTEVPDVQDAARKILAIYDGEEAAPDEVINSPEPCRAIAYHLGYAHMDGTPWWDAVMERVADGN